MCIRDRFCCALSVLLLLCSACAESNVNSGANQEDISYTEIAVAAVETALKDRLKNPESLQVHSANLDGESFENDIAYFGTIIVDYSAQNSFGGYNRNTAKSYVEISKVDGVVDVYKRQVKDLSPMSAMMPSTCSPEAGSTFLPSLP